MEAGGKQLLEQKEEIAGAHLLLEAFFNNAPDYHILLNNHLDIVTFNRTAFAFTLKFFQLRLTAGKKITGYISGSFVHEFERLCIEALQGRQVNYEHFIRNNVDGMWYNFAITPIWKNEHVIGLVLVGVSINEQKKQEKTIKHQSNSLSIIAQLQSHQVRQPVSSILGLMNLIREENYVARKEYLEALEEATKQLDNIIQTIVSQSRMV